MIYDDMNCLEDLIEESDLMDDVRESASIEDWEDALDREYHCPCGSYCLDCLGMSLRDFM